MDGALVAGAPPDPRPESALEQARRRGARRKHRQRVRAWILLAIAVLLIVGMVTLSVRLEGGATRLLPLLPFALLGAVPLLALVALTGQHFSARLRAARERAPDAAGRAGRNRAPGITLAAAVLAVVAFFAVFVELIERSEIQTAVLLVSVFFIVPLGFTGMFVLQRRPRRRQSREERARRVHERLARRADERSARLASGESEPQPGRGHISLGKATRLWRSGVSNRMGKW